ncbi:caspase recruitment domain-containing protein 11-like [Mizuhopecten yessoensis]|uniref:caspase recruitment domain-containing protein 11-like n=1 Tax=Mizuhopecten yessoensis TaxID=6573 RepID=UPI000B45B7C9|nr:caspase recruitment domain-containing protein 11-like [Mizuhopecten yessoensis]
MTDPSVQPDPLTPGDLYEIYIEPNRYTIVNGIDPREYFDRLRELRVLTSDDTELIMNKYHTRRTRAGFMLDILQTKGNNGCQHFLDTMEYHNPETYKAITGENPREPPLDFKVTRFSCNMNLVNNLSETIRTLQDQAQGNAAMKQKLEDLETGLLFAQNDKKELENETEILRLENQSLTHRLQALERNCSSIVEENSKLKDASMEYLKNSLEYTKEREDYREKWRNCQYKLDQREREIIELKGALSDALCPNCSQDETDRCLQATTAKMPAALGCEVLQERQEVEKQILKEERDEAQQNCEDIMERMDRLEVQLSDYQDKCMELETRLQASIKEKNKINTAYMDRKKKVEEYFDRIKELENEKKILEELRIKEQIRANEESTQRIQLFNDKHELETLYDELKSNMEIKRLSDQISLPETDRQYVDRKQSIYDISDDIQDSSIPLDPKYNTLPVTLMGHSSNHAGAAGFSRCASHIVHTQKSIPHGPMETFELVSRDASNRPDSLGMKVHISDSRKQKVTPVLSMNLPLAVDRDAISCYVRHNDNISESGKSHPEIGSESGNYHRGKGNESGDSLEPEEETIDQFYPKAKSETSEDSSVSDENELTNYEVVMPMIPCLPEKANSHDPKFTVKVPMPFLDTQLEIAGGNITGIFIQKILDKSLNNWLSLGDQIMSVVLSNKVGNSVTQVFHNCTQEQVRKSLISDSLPFSIDTVELNCAHNKKVNQEALKWMKENNSNGDFFYTRSNFTWQGDRTAGQLEVNIGDIFMVLNTTCRPRFWLAVKFDRDRQTWESDTGFIPNTSEALRSRVKMQIKRIESMEGKHTGRWKGIKCRSEHYTMILPVKALTRSPVLLYGQEKVVTTVQKIMSTEMPDCSKVDIMKNDLIDIHRHFPQISGRHSIRKGSLTPVALNQSLNIIIYLRLRNEADPEQLRTILGSDFDTATESSSECLESRLQTIGLTYDTIDIPSPEVKDRASLLRCLCARISRYQDRVCWLGKQSLTPADQWKFQSLICHSKLSNVYSDDQQESPQPFSALSLDDSRSHWARSANIFRSFSTD